MFYRVIALSSLAIFWTVSPNATASAEAQARGQGRGQAPPARMRFEAMDKDRDGAISRQEWQGNLRSFQVHDWNGDGQLSGQEVVIGARRNANWDEADHRPNVLERYVSWTQAGFDNLDHNRDRRITRNEWHYDMETFRRVDRNRDGAMDQAEFLGERLGRRPRR